MFKKLTNPQRHPEVLEIIQITDCHIFSNVGMSFGGIDTGMSLQRIIAFINEKENPDMFLVTGDLVNKAERPAYERIFSLLKNLKTPVYCLPGNHDIPEMMHDLLNEGNIRTAGVVDGNNWRVILLDTVIPDSDSGYLAPEQLVFLQETLDQPGKRHVLIAMHHHPVSVDSPWMDTMILKNPEDLFGIIDRYPSVKGIIWGHIHQEFSQLRKSVHLLGTPSTCIQFRLETPVSAPDDKPPGYRRIKLHRDGTMASEVVWLTES